MEPINSAEQAALAAMAEWTADAPPEGKSGTLNGARVRNTQLARLKFALVNAVAAKGEEVYFSLAKHAGRRDGESYVSKNKTWMRQPVALEHGWYFEGCTSLLQKLAVAELLAHAGLSDVFVKTVHAFVANKPVTRKASRQFQAPEDNHAQAILKLLESEVDALDRVRIVIANRVYLIGQGSLDAAAGRCIPRLTS